MKISTLIRLLLGIQEKHGDIRVHGNPPQDDTFGVGRVIVDKGAKKTEKTVLLSQRKPRRK